MTRSPHDALFKAAFSHAENAAGLLRGVVEPELAETANWATLSLEPGSFVDEELAARHSDLLYSVELSGHRSFIYVLLEHQSTADPEMAFRVLEYMTRIWVRARQEHPEQARRPILPVVVSHAPGGWAAPIRFHQLFSPEPSRVPGLARHVPAFELLLVDLAHVTNEQIKATAMTAFAQLAIWLLRDARDTMTLERNLETWARTLADAAREEHGLAAIGQLFRYMFLVVEGVHIQIFRDILRSKVPEAEGSVMTIAEQLRREGLVEGERRFLRGLLEDKFGALSSEQSTRIASLSEPELQAARKRLLTADSVEAVLSAPATGGT